MILSPFVSALMLATSSMAQMTELPRVAVFSGPTATIQNSEPLVTSNLARKQKGLDEAPMGWDPLRPQRLAAPVEVYIEAYSAHPLESDAADLYGPPDGYVNADGEFSETPTSDKNIPVFVATLFPEDGLYMLPYMALQKDGSPWDGHCTATGAPMEQCRVPFYPDASRIFEEIDRFGIAPGGTNNILKKMAVYDFWRPAPSGGYRNGLPAAERTDMGEGSIEPEVWGEDFFTYTPFSTRPGLSTLAQATNMIQEAMGSPSIATSGASSSYEGGIWLEGSPTVEESMYWFSLVIDTDKPLVGLGAQRTHTLVSEDGSRNIIDGVDYITSGVWQDEQGADKVGGVMIQEEIIFTAREVQKGDDRPGGYVATGGHGGIVGGTGPMKLTFTPTRLHTYKSEVNLTKMPQTVPGVKVAEDGTVTETEVQVKDDAGMLISDAMPQVNMIKHGRYGEENLDEVDTTLHPPIEILTTRNADLEEFELNGFVLEGIAPYGSGGEQVMAALTWASLRGMPVVRVGRGNHEGFTAVTGYDLFIEGENLTATKARILLMAALLKLGALPVPVDPDNATEDELAAIKAKVAEYQEIFLTH